MKKLMLLGIAASAALVVGFGWQKPSYPPIVTNKQLYAQNDFRGKPAPKLEVEQWMNGTAPDTKGKVVVVDFWATWCGPCRKLIPEMNEWHKKFGKDVVFIGISDEKPEVVAEFMKKTPIEYASAIDQQKRMSKALGVQGIPHVMVISPDGIVRWQGFPGSQEDPLTAEKLMQIVAASKP